MSGRDMRRFVVNHRSDSGDSLVRRAVDGLGSNKYKAVDYEQLKLLTAQKKLRGNEKLIKVKKLQHASKQSQEQNVIKQHKGVWQKEFLRLNHSRRQLQAEIEIHIRSQTERSLLSQFFTEIEHLDFEYDRLFQDFKKNTVEPIWNLREDLLFWIQENKRGIHNSQVQMDDADTVMDTLENIKSQQAHIVNILDHEQKRLEDELESITVSIPEMKSSASEDMAETGIPEPALELECPDFDLKVSMLQEFILLDGRYVDKLRDLEDTHAVTLSSSSGGWSEDDHHLFTWILEQYPYDMQNRRMLYIDRLRRHLPHKRRAEIVDHEEWWMVYKYYHKRRRALITDWKRDRAELLNRITVLCSEACTQHTLRNEREREKQLQNEICEALLSKVEAWRHQKMAALQLQHQLDEQQHQTLMEKRREEERREADRRQKQKQQIKEYQDNLEVKRKEEEVKDAVTLMQLKEKLEKQAAIDRERVKFRDGEYEKKEAEKLRKKEKREMEEIEKERILEAIRRTVRPHVECDLLRVWKDTESWKARQKPEPEPDIQRPLFELNSFTSKQITSDPRHKIETQLRAAGLHDNAHARQVMAQTQSLMPSRRDMQSTVFKQ